MFKFLRKKIGIIGYGNMGSAIAGRIKARYRVWVFDKDKEKTRGLEGINLPQDITGLVKQSDVVIIAVKPQDFDIVLDETKDYIKGKLIISIAAGIKTGYIEERLGRVRVIRAMPNLPAMIGEGANCICRGGLATTRDLAIALELFELLGTTFTFDEDKMDAVTAVSGSGPGYLYDFLHRENIDYRNIPQEKIRDFSVDFKQAAELVGLDKKDAGRLVDVTIRGSLAMLSATDEIPVVLRDKVASKGGTTEAGLNVLHGGGSLIEAVKKAAERAKELSRG
jgi:pyrroline-5-carboxylate reductase